ncbi:hypothetical protein JK628_10150 [Shewanella sp. KX20019]|uniref:hypothetical protein n=1 Tax=Shewanella sp. KX20019 TaxID=2803864 RepID=UPI001926C30B|nr:hypothetical protein [Shewanella sp. KX20019]QQX82132.1 hypothetical protein JK628_10150 [Shewanella sp. KX20019]
MKFSISYVLILLYAIIISATPTHVLAKHDKDGKQQGHNKQQALPYGLQKKLDRGEPLPPGWQKKLKRGDRLSDDLFKRGKVTSPVDSNGNLVIDIDDVPIKVNNKTREIIDILIKGN